MLRSVDANNVPLNTMARALLLAGMLMATASSIDNGLGMSPPMGWRSWNEFGPWISQDLFENVIMTGLTDKSRKVNGKPTSLAELGYDRLGMDDGYQACGTGVNGSFHDKDNNLLINKTLFPDMKAMNQKAHSMGLKTGWYLNNCVCNEKETRPANLTLPKDAQMLADLEFDGVKVDSCGPSHDLVYFADLINKTGRDILIENCNNFFMMGDTSKTQNCPANFFRTGGDIFGNWAAIIDRIQLVITKLGFFFQDPNQALSRPGCWAYPDMLEVGCTRQGPVGGNFTQSRTHFGMWCIVSSPLILGMDFRQTELVDLVWPIITNTEAIAVNQQFRAPEDGIPHAGKMVKQKAPGISQYEYTVPVTNDGGHFLFGGSEEHIVRDTLKVSWQVWAKNLTGGKVATLLVNAEDFAQDVSVTLEELSILTGSAKVRDVWNHEDLPNVNGTILAKDLAPYDSVFYVLDPVA